MSLSENAYNVLATLKSGKVPTSDVLKFGPAHFGRLNKAGYASKGEDGSWSITKAGREALAAYTKGQKAAEREAKKVAKAVKTAVTETA